MKLIYTTLVSALLALTLTAGGTVDEQPDKTVASSLVEMDNSMSYYLDTRDFSTLSVASDISLPLGIRVWGFTDLDGDQNGEAHEFNDFFMEYRALYSIPEELTFGIKGLGLVTEYNNFNGSDNDLFRFGLAVTHTTELLGKKTCLQLRLMPYDDTSEDNQQVSLSYCVAITDKLSLTGFADYNIIDDGSNQWVIEPQLAYKVTDSMDLLLEYRYNGFESDDPDLDGDGLAFGARYRF